MEATAFSERLRTPWWLWLIAAGFTGSLGLAFGAAFGEATGVACGVASALAVGAGLVAAEPVVAVAAGHLRAGRARVPIAVLGDVRTLAGDELRAVRGPRANALAFQLTRAWVPSAVLVEVTDPADPTPYLLVSTRQPDALARALRAAVAALPNG